MIGSKWTNFADEQFSDKNFAHFDPLFSEKEKKNQIYLKTPLMYDIYYIGNYEITNRLANRRTQFFMLRHLKVKVESVFLF